ncbi:helix-turn-helix transcriptional regulator [Streptomyces sp. HNM0663]|uniref:Helix-turn-helix transcriptional regulator n=1 Tax=Streptomyces chengmaiensis TaxID=3040919 RepID=A0ABT6HXF2_9ACTN|nr:helix-turn-helix transcriptional regulator [Streptomyces chengmaiensis]MDH2392739.1 helix-turn-helix transcriptional regulator [Streptomyces chengmaiensis]
MPVRSNPTARQLRFGTELRRLRERAGLSSTEAAKLLGIKQAQVSNMEGARFGVSAERLRAIARHYSCTDEQLIEALIGMTGDRKRGWWEEYREILAPSLLDLAELEAYGVRLRTAHTSHIPGLLQIAQHARVIFEQMVPAYTPPEIEDLVSYRIKRQRVLFQDGPPPFHALIHEAALRMQFGGPTVAKQQLQHLLDMSERDNITIQVIPFDAGAYPGAGQSIYYVHGPVPQLDTVQLDQAHGPRLVDAEPGLQVYRQLFARMEAIALKAATSRDLIHDIAQGL